MKKNRAKTNWILDSILLFIFLILFFLDWTGVALHQWLGMLIAVLITIHSLLHLDWIECAFSRFFSKSAGKVKVYALLDTLLLFGFLLILESGLVISTWLNLTWIDYSSWWVIHIFSAIFTLSLTVIKLALHRNWIITATQKFFSKRKVAVPAGASPQSLAVSRRQFLGGMALVSLASALAIYNVLPKETGIELENGQASDQLSQSFTDTQPATPQPTSPADTSQKAVATDNPVPTPTTQPTAAPSATAQAAPVENDPPAAIALTCLQSCRRGKHCSYPGDCRSYRDVNNNGLCDLGECA